MFGYLCSSLLFYYGSGLSGKFCCFEVGEMYYFVLGFIFYYLFIMKQVIGDVLIKIGQILVFLSVKSIRLCIKIFKFIKSDEKRVISFFALLGIVVLSRFLVNRAARVRL
jgi:hypothetical protein